MYGKFQVIIALFVSMAVSISYAETATTSTSTSTSTSTTDSTAVMAKDSWLNSMTPLLPDLICKGFIQDVDLKKRFDEIKMTYEQCVALIPDSAKKCQDKLYAQIPDQINAMTAGTWGKNLGECIGKDFAEQHLIPKK